MKKCIIGFILLFIALCSIYMGLYFYNIPNTPSVATPPPPPVVIDNKNTITISAVGDCTFGTDINTVGGGTFELEFINNGSDFSHFFKNIKTIFEADDITIVNLEGPLSARGEREDKEYAFIGSPDFAKILSSSSVEAANLANNHTMDYGQIAYDDTIAALSANGVDTFGKDKYIIKEIDGIKVALIGTNTLNWYERMDFYRVLEQVKKQNPHLIVASFHWGEENEIDPTEVQMQLAHDAIDNGVDLVIGHHPHIIQGIEKYKGKYILYSLGNFCFGGNRSPVDKDTFIFQQSFIFEDGVLTEENASAIPCSVSSVSARNNFQPTPLFNDNHTRVKEKIIERSLPFGELDIEFK